ncbi:MAG: hypothetical protein R6U96_00180 [Promethearchaeia archaeon]
MPQGSRYRYQYHILLGIIVLTNSILLLFKIFLNIFLWGISFSDIFIEGLALLWPAFGISCAIELFRKDKWGWGGIFFHIFILYCGIYYSILSIMNILSFTISFHWGITFSIHFSIAFLGWLGYILYYD